MRPFSDSIKSRTLVVLLLGLVLFHLLSLWTYQVGLRSELDLNNESRLAERLVSIKRTVMGVPVQEREAIAHALSGGPIEAHWGAVKLASKATQDDAAMRGLRDGLISLDPELAHQDLSVGAPRTVGVDPHRIDISVRAPDDGWLNVGVTRLSGSHDTMHSIIGSTTLMALGVVLVSVLMVRWLTRPLRIFAAAAQRAYAGSEPVEVALDGPREVCDLAVAFNDMQRRIKRLVDDRTQTLAAVSHDLKTPLTRLRLRAAELGEQSAAIEMEADLDEMEAMLDASLMFLRGEQVDEPVRELDLASLLQTIRNDACDAGHDVALDAPARVPMRGRHLPLKRALNNLVWNAIRYGGRAEVALVGAADSVSITIDDQGPGIPDDQIEAVFAPLTRIETSRNRQTGGVGLGLTIARSIVRGHGGEVTLANRAEGGLRALVRLPRQLD